MTNQDLQIATMKPYDLMSEEEFQAVMYFEDWCRKAKYRTVQHMSNSEAFEIFKDEIYGLCMGKIGRGEDKDHFTDVLWKFKKYRSGDDLDVERARQYPIDKLVASFGVEPNFRKNICCLVHEDKSPSMTLYQPTNTWYCHSCHQGGDTIKLLMIKSSMTFAQSVKHLT